MTQELIIGTTQRCYPTWNDSGSGEKASSAYFRTNPLAGYFSIGDMGQNQHGDPVHMVTVVKPTELGIKNQALKRPEGYSMVWADHGSGAHESGSFWTPIAPEGYVALGIVSKANRHDNPPSLDAVMCVREDLCVPGQAGALIWNSDGTGSDTNFGSWTIEANENGITSGTFCAATSFSAPEVAPTLHCLDKTKVSFPKPPSKTELLTLVEKFAPYVYQNTHENYLMTSVEYGVEHTMLHDYYGKIDIQASLQDLPTGRDVKDQFFLELEGTEYRHGDPKEASIYVHAKYSGYSSFIDLQYWFYYAYNGPGTAVVEKNDHPTTIPFKNLGAHEGDWEHITVRIDLEALDIDKVYFSQHSSGQWVSKGDLERKGSQVVVYSSLNGHASYPSAGPNYSEHHNIADLADFYLLNDCDNGPIVDGSKVYQLISAPYLGSNAPKEPRWLNFYNRWGPTQEVEIDEDVFDELIDAVVGKGLGEAFTLILNLFRKSLVSHFEDEMQQGPTGPKMKGNWAGHE